MTEEVTWPFLCSPDELDRVARGWRTCASLGVVPRGFAAGGQPAIEVEFIGGPVWSGPPAQSIFLGEFNGVRFRLYDTGDVLCSRDGDSGARPVYRREDGSEYRRGASVPAAQLGRLLYAIGEFNRAMLAARRCDALPGLGVRFDFSRFDCRAGHVRQLATAATPGARRVAEAAMNLALGLPNDAPGLRAISDGLRALLYKVSAATGNDPVFFARKYAVAAGELAGAVVLAEIEAIGAEAEKAAEDRGRREGNGGTQ